MRTLLEISTFKNGKLREHRRGYSKSWVQNFEELLYVHHAQIQAGAPRVVYGLNKSDYSMDAQAYLQNDLVFKGMKGNFAVASPPGGVPHLIPTGTDQYSGGQKGWAPSFQSFIPGDMLGIQIGTGNTAVTPQDKCLVARVSHGGRAAIGAGTRVESWLAGDNGAMDIYGTLAAGAIGGVIVVPARQYLVSSIKFYLGRSGNPGTITLNIFSIHGNMGQPRVDGSTTIQSATTNGNTLPTGAPWEWREFTFGAPFYMYPGIPYLFILYAATGTSGNKGLLRWQTGTQATRSAAGYSYSGTGSLSNQATYQTLFDLYGSATAEVLYAGCEVHTLAVAAPSVTFKIRRHYYNVTGGDISVAEVGINAAGTTYISGLSDDAGNAFPLQIARDVVGPAVTWHNAELLEVVYTPSITV